MLCLFIARGRSKASKGLPSVAERSRMAAPPVPCVLDGGQALVPAPTLWKHIVGADLRVRPGASQPLASQV